MRQQLPVDLGIRAQDRATGIEGTLCAITLWEDRSAEVAIRRDGVDNNGEPWAVHWFPHSRLVEIF